MASTLACMGATPTECPRCGRGLTDAFICEACTLDATAQTRVIVTLARHLPAKLARLRTNWASGYRPAPAESPLPFDARASAMLGRVESFLDRARGIGFVRLDHNRPLLDPAKLARHPEALALTRDIECLREDIITLLDPPPDKRYLGPCDLLRQGCQADLHVAEDEHGAPVSPTVECPACHRLVSVEQRRGELLDSAMDHIGTMKEVTRLLRYYGGTEAVSHDTLRGLVRHGRVTSIGEVMVASEDGRTRFVAAYRVGDVLEALRATRRVKRSKKGE